VSAIAAVRAKAVSVIAAGLGAASPPWRLSRYPLSRLSSAPDGREVSHLVYAVACPSSVTAADGRQTSAVGALATRSALLVAFLAQLRPDDLSDDLQVAYEAEDTLRGVLLGASGLRSVTGLHARLIDVVRGTTPDGLYSHHELRLEVLHTLTL
jgi:hypothetical protein